MAEEETMGAIVKKRAPLIQVKLEPMDNTYVDAINPYEEAGHIYIVSIDEMEDAIDTLERYVEDPKARVKWEKFHNTCGLMLYNSSRDTVYHIENPVVMAIRPCPRPEYMMSTYPSLTPGQVKNIHGEIGQINASDRTAELHYDEVCLIRRAEKGNRMSLLIKKLDWLDDNPYPDDRMRKYWPTWWNKLTRVASEEIICMECRAKPADIDNIVKPAWEVHHISDDNVVRTTDPRLPPPSSNDQFFKCPNCAGTWDLDDDYYHYSHKTTLYVIGEWQAYYQPILNPIPEPKYINKNWIAYVEKPAKKLGEKKGKRSHQSIAGSPSDKENEEGVNYMAGIKHSKEWIEENERLVNYMM